MNIDIEQRIKELQGDSKFFFKQTEEIIDIIYRQAIQDCTCELPPKNFTDEVAKEINNKIIDDVIFKVKENDGHDYKGELDEALKVVKSQEEKIEEQEKMIKKLNSQIYDLKENQKKLFPKKSNKTDSTYNNMNNQFQSGMVSGLKYSMMALEGHNIEEAYGLIIGKYNEVSKPQKEYWP